MSSRITVSRREDCQGIWDMLACRFLKPSKYSIEKLQNVSAMLFFFIIGSISYTMEYRVYVL